MNRMTVQAMLPSQRHSRAALIAEANLQIPRNHIQTVNGDAEFLSVRGQGGSNSFEELCRIIMVAKLAADIRT